LLHAGRLADRIHLHLQPTHAHAPPS
jgi:hypothetical protein